MCKPADEMTQNHVRLETTFLKVVCVFVQGFFTLSPKLPRYGFGPTVFRIIDALDSTKFSKDLQKALLH